MQNEEAKALLTKYKNGIASEEDVNQLIFWIQQFESTEFPALKEADLDAISNEIWSQLKIREKPRMLVLWPRLIAASILVCLSVAGIIFFKKSKRPEVASQQLNRILPGSGLSIIKTGGGKLILLEKGIKGILARNEHALIQKSGEGKITYQKIGVDGMQMAWDTIEIPAGGKIYQLTLSDGTKVFLNAATAFRYPEGFNKKSRVVELMHGEAYFEVVHHKNFPFNLTVRGNCIADLGTHFNVNAYRDETAVITTLLEGSISIAANKKTVTLKPGQQAISPSLFQNITVREADTDEAVAWKDGLFMFNSEDLASIMRQVSRWYNVEVVFKDKSMEKKLFSGSMSRFGDVSMVLSKLALTGSVHFTIKGRRIEVTK